MRWLGEIVVAASSWLSQGGAKLIRGGWVHVNFVRVLGCSWLQA
jgi:hypothetical protein